MTFKVIVCVLLLSTWTSAQLKQLNQVLAWKQLDYEFPSDNDRQYALDNGIFTPGSGTPIDVAVHYNRKGDMRVFTTVPRFTVGIPITLGIVTNKTGPDGPLISAYPNYETHNASNTDCNGIISAFRVAIDECDQMWVIDSGMIGGTQACPPQLLTYDLNTDKLIKRYQFTTDVYTPVNSLLINPAVDIRDPPPQGRCQKAMVYIADVTNHGLVVYDSERNAAWRVENQLMYPLPEWGNHTIAGESFVLMDGMFAINYTPRGIKGERYLYFHALASETENAVPLRVLDNQTNWLESSEAMPEAFQTLGRRGVQVALEAMDRKGNLYFNTHDPLTLFVWNIKTPYERASFKVVGNDQEQLQFASGMKVVSNRGQEELWMSTCRYQKIATGTLNPNETNFRILACRTKDLLKGRQCAPLRYQHSRINKSSSTIV